MSKSILFIISSYLLIEIIYCPSDSCQDKFPFQLDSSDNIIDSSFTHGYLRKVWHHADSCNSYQIQDSSISGSTTSDSLVSCCYIHIEYRSLIDGERYDQYGCIDVMNPWEDYGGGIDNVTNRTEEIKEKLKDVTTDDNTKIVDPDKNLHVKILCSANFLKLSLFSLLVLILF